MNLRVEILANVGVHVVLSWWVNGWIDKIYLAPSFKIVHHSTDTTIHTYLFLMCLLLLEYP